MSLAGCRMPGFTQLRITRMRIAQKKTVVQRSSSSAAETTASPASDGSTPLIPNTSQYSIICAPSITRRAPPSIRPTPRNDAAKRGQHRLSEPHHELRQRVVVVGAEHLQEHAQHEDQDVDPERHPAPGR